MHHSLITYLLESSVCLLAFYALYLLLLRNESCFRYNRFYLLGATVVAFLLPLLELPSFQEVASIPAFVPTLTPFVVNVAVEGEPAPGNPVLDLGTVLLLLYGIGVGVFAFRFLRQLLHLYQFVRKHKGQADKIQGFTVIPTQGEWPTFSFFGYIFWDNSQPLTQEEQERILQHEQVHVQQGHSYDLMYLEVLTVVFWFNPLLHLYRKALTATHEFLADAHVIQTQDKTAYGLLLAKQVLQKNNFALGHYFNKSLTLKRLKMIHHPKSSTSKVKQVLAFPLLGLLAVSLSSHQILPAEPILQIPMFAEPAPAPPKSVKAEFIPKEGIEMMRYFLRNLMLPSQAKSNQEYGGVFVQITLGKEGNIDNYHILEAAHPSLEKEILRVLKSAPAWGTSNAKWTPSTFIYPFEFRKTTKEGYSAEAKQSFQKMLTQVTAKLKDSEIRVVQPMIIGRFEGETLPVTTPAKQIPSQPLAPSASTASKSFAEPQFPGGTPALMKFLGDKMRIPASAQKNNEYGGVFVQVTIAKDGTPGNFKVLQARHASLEQEVLRVVKLMPTWEANGATSPATYILPFSIIIDGFKNDKKVINQEFEQDLAKVSAQVKDKTVRIAPPLYVTGYGPVE